MYFASSKKTFHYLVKMILIHDTYYDLESIRHKVVGGGILPVCRNKEGKLMILLGRERYISHWRGSLKWSGFEGGKKNDEDVENIAAREFVEESLGVVKLNNELTYSTIDTVLDILKQSLYCIRLNLCINHNDADNVESRYHTIYVIEVPYQPECVEKFEKKRKELVQFRCDLTKWKELLESIPNEFPFIREESIIKGKKVKAIVNVTLVNNTFCVQYLCEDGMYKITRDNFKNEYSSLYYDWYLLRLQLQENVKMFSKIPDCIRVETNCFGFIQDAKLNDEYIEKQSIQWWSIQDLNSVIQNRGFHNTEYFRAYFLPVLQRIIQELKKYE